MLITWSQRQWRLSLLLMEERSSTKSGGWKFLEIQTLSSIWVTWSGNEFFTSMVILHVHSSYFIVTFSLFYFNFISTVSENKPSFTCSAFTGTKNLPHIILLIIFASFHTISFLVLSSHVIMGVLLLLLLLFVLAKSQWL